MAEWFLSYACSGPGALTSDQTPFLEWLIFILFSPCGQAILQGALNAAFLLALTLTLIHARLQQRRKQQQQKQEQEQEQEEEEKEKGKGKGKGKAMAGPLYIATMALLALSALFSYFSLGFCVATSASSAPRVATSSLEAIALTSFALAAAHELPRSSLKYPRPLRAWWFLGFIVSALRLLSAIIRLASYGYGSSASYPSDLQLDDVSSICLFPVSALLFFVSLDGNTGLRIEIPAREDRITEPLLANGSEAGSSSKKEKEKKEKEEEEEEAATTTAFATAGLLSKCFWLWLTPLLRKGASEVLQIGDVPELSPADRADVLYALFHGNWLESRGKNPLRQALARTFKLQLSFTAFLALCKAISMYVGPLLIQSFVDFLESGSRSYSEGFMLVFILLLAKFVEVLSTHQYQFLSQKLGMMIRSCLITTIYKKGLRLSSSARQSHGAGQIINYMTVDVQQINDSIVQIHNIWMLPFQVVLALLILYNEIGIATFAGFITMLLFAALISNNSRLLRKYSGQVMGMKDVRMKATTEVLNYMRIIKLQAWEDYFRRKIEECRKGEYRFLRGFQFALSSNITMLGMSTSIVAIVTFSACILIGTNLTAAKVFTVISTFNILSEPIRTFPQAIISVSQALVSLQRLDSYVMSKEIEDYVERGEANDSSGCSIIVEGGRFTWAENETTSSSGLSGIDLRIPQGHLVAVVGTVGSGKSSLLAALLGEMPKLSGRVKVCGTTSYVPQTAWIQSGTVEENILFGMPMDRSKYRRTIKACSLEQDFALFEFGDQTEIGERGINLSGGQKQRIQLARALYQGSDVYFLDDVFSAVDAHTGSAIFKDSLLGLLKNKTRVLVTHQVEFLHKADLILVMHDGVIKQSGTYSDLLEAGAEFGSLVAAHKKSIGAVEIGRGKEEENVGVEEWVDNTYDDSVKLLTRTLSSPFSSQESLPSRRTSGSYSTSNVKRTAGKLVEAEKRETGRVGWNVYWLYLTSAFGPFFVLLVLVIQLLSQSCSIGADFWLSHETSLTDFDATTFITFYILLCAGGWVFSIVRAILMAFFSLNTTQSFYFSMLKSIFRAPMSFFDTTPTGRILTRSSNDQATLDIMLPLSFSLAMLLYFGTLGVLVVTTIVTWPIIFVIIPLAWIYLQYQTFYINSSRELTRLDSITKSPVIHHFTETIAGFMVIRGFRKQDEFAATNLIRVNANLKMDFHFNAANDWLGFRLEIIGAVVLCAAAFFLVVLPEGVISSSLAALSLSYGLSLNTTLAASVFFSCTVENKMVAVERIGQYTRLPTEAPLVIDGSVPSKDWPSHGAIKIRDLAVRYQPTMPLVLKGITLDIIGGQKIGVVGRTGSGKSTMVQVMFRIIEPTGGQILFDEIDITSVGLHDLRSRLGIIPQDPVLFEGTIRTNMDPLGVHTDEEIWEGLEKCQLADMVNARNDKLDAIVVDNGENWSVGQRQLLCLGRALLKKSRILFLDEATASVDTKTDAVLQAIIKQEFDTSTVISIAHRIPTVMESDMVMVLDAGLLKEYDNPARLLESPSTMFASLVREYTTRSSR